LTVFELRDGHYGRVAAVTGLELFEAERPFPAEIVPAFLLAGLPGSAGP
jgi:hypothetical protein